MIKILKIEFQNYRQYKHFAIDFSTSGDNDLHILRAKNGTGKTTFLNAVLWCLYNEEKYLSDSDRALPIINVSLLQSAKVGTKETVFVRMTIQDEQKLISFERSLGYSITEDPFTHKKNATPGSSVLKVVITDLTDTSNTVVHNEELWTAPFVKQYFDSEIFDYYFFDGENLENYFNADSKKRTKIKNSIYNIAQVTLLETAINHLNSLVNEKSRQASKLFGSNATLITESQTLKNDLGILKADILRYEEENGKARKRVAEINATLESVKPMQLKQQSRKKLENDLIAAKTEMGRMLVKRSSFIINYGIYLNYYPLVISTLNMIYEKEKSGSLPPSIDKTLLKKILDEHITTCPVCQNNLDDKAILAIQKLIESLDVSSVTSNTLSGIKPHLEEVVKRVKQYSAKKNKLLCDIKALEDNIKSIESQLDEISSFLSKVGTVDHINISKLEDERSRLLSLINNNNRSIGANEAQIHNKTERLKELDKQITQAEKDAVNKNHLMQQVRVLRHLLTNFEEVRAVITTEIRQEIERITWEFFDAMVWKTHTFDHIEINENYLLSLFNQYGTEMTGSASATEKMALAYAFTFAIHEASGKNCPLIIDSPLGRVSDDNRVNMARELLKVSKSKQIIMLFTPDEYSDDVRKLYDLEAATVRDICLSDDESEIENIGG